MTIDRARVAELTRTEAEALDERTGGSAEMYTRANRTLSGGVASSYQARDPWPIYLERGAGPKVWDVDHNELWDFHNGFGSMVQGHAHPASRRRDQGALRSRHPLRRADRGRGRGRRGAGQALPAAQVALYELGLRVDDGCDPHRAGADQARSDHEDVRLLPRPPRRGDGLDRRRLRRDRPARGTGFAALWRRDPAGDGRPHLRGPLQRRREPRPPPDRARRGGPEAGLRDHGGGDDEPRRGAAAAGVPRGGPRDHPAPRRDPDLR